MRILVPFKALEKRFPQHFDGTGKSEPQNQDFLNVVRLMLASITVDDAYYRELYPDVSAAVDAGTYESTRDHFIQHGYFEGRLPGRLDVDSAWYTKNYEDVFIGIENGEIASAEDHFNLHGYFEGRMPIKL